MIWGTHLPEALADSAAEVDERGDREHPERPARRQLQRQLGSPDQLQTREQRTGGGSAYQRAKEGAWYDAWEVDVVEGGDAARPKQQQVVCRLQVEALLHLGERAQQHMQRHGQRQQQRRHRPAQQRERHAGQVGGDVADGERRYGNCVQWSDLIHNALCKYVFMFRYVFELCNLIYVTNYCD